MYRSSSTPIIRLSKQPLECQLGIDDLHLLGHELPDLHLLPPSQAQTGPEDQCWDEANERSGVLVI
jgi:hypothetical protein